MPIINGLIAGGWAVVDVLVGVSDQRRRLLRKHKRAVPQLVHVRALIDTGSSVSAFAPRLPCQRPCVACAVALSRQACR